MAPCPPTAITERAFCEDDRAVSSLTSAMRPQPLRLLTKASNRRNQLPAISLCTKSAVVCDLYLRIRRAR